MVLGSDTRSLMQPPENDLAPAELVSDNAESCKRGAQEAGTGSNPGPAVFVFHGNDMTTASCLDAALAYAARGWHVFPLHSLRNSRCSCGAAECGNVAKHPRTPTGFKDATTDAAAIRAWWARWPDANVGIATGAVSGVDVLDVDSRHAGDESLETRFPGLEAAVESLTGGGGRHLCWIHAPGVGSRAGILPGVDVRGDGGYVVAPPSIHASGRRYQWEAMHDPEEHALTETPPELLAMVRAPVEARRAPAGAVGTPARGTWHDALVSLGGTMRRRGMAPEVIELALVAQAEQWAASLADGLGVDRDRIRQYARSLAHYAPDPGSSPPSAEESEAARAAEAAYVEATGEGGAGEPATAPPASGADTAPSASPPPPGGIPLAHRRHLTDLGNACRLVDRHGPDIRWAPGLGWLAWPGTHWQEDATEDIARRTKETIVSFYGDAAKLAIAASKAQDETEQKRLAGIAEKLLSHASKSQAVARIKAAVELARTEPEIIVPIEAFSERPESAWLLNCTNGTIDLRSGKLRDHERSDHLMKLAPTAYDPRAQCPRWDLFLVEVFDGDESMGRFIQRLFGYGLTASTREQSLPIFWGNGANGKSTLVNAASLALGPYAGAAPPDVLIEDKYGSRHPTERADLFGRRLVFCMEMPEGARLNEVLVKLLTGGDRIKARKMRQDFFEFTPTHKLVAGTNHKPEVKGTDYAMWRRLLLVPFTRQFRKGHDADELLPEKLASEAPGILAWMMRGCLAWQERGLDPPASVLAATDEYRQESDLVGRWVGERCESIPGARTPSGALYRDFERWSHDAGERDQTETAFGRRLSELGFPVCRVAYGRGRGGIMLRPLEIHEPSDDPYQGDSGSYGP